MASRRALKGGAPRLLGHHGGAEGFTYRRVYDALAAEFGPFSTLGCLEAGRAAAAYVQLQAATRALAAGQRARRVGRGRRPNVQHLERLARRQGLADGTWSQALDKLGALTRRPKRPATPADLMAKLRAVGSGS